MNSLLMALSDSEAMIAGKTHSEILSMPRPTRSLWYTRISSESKEEAMMIVETVRRAKMSAAQMGKTLSEETRVKISMALTGKVLSEEHKARISLAISGENHPSFNNWASREPYCHLWNEPLRERYRNHYGRVCVLTDTLRSVMGPESGLDDFEGHEIFSKVRLSVHHIRGNKMAGCDGIELALIPLQGKFNNKKFDGLKLEDHPFYITLFLFKDIERKHRSRQ